MVHQVKTTLADFLRQTGFSSKKIEYFDRICIGTSIHVSLEAYYLKKPGVSVLMIDKDKTFGGAWKTITIDKIEDVENAIHYFLPNEKGIMFLRKNLGLSIQPSLGKFRFFKLFNFFYFKFSYGSLIGRLIHKLFYPNEVAQQHLIHNLPGYGNRFDSLACILRHIYSTFMLIYSKRGERSYYLSSGSNEMTKKVQSMLENSGVQFMYGSKITKIYFDLKDRRVFCEVGNKMFVARSLVFGHGARLPKLLSSNGVLEIKEKIHPRPAYHLVLKDITSSHIFEAIMTSDPLIKYLHNVTRYSSLRNGNTENKKIFVFALRPEVKNFKGLADELLEKLKEIKAIGQNAYIVSSLFSSKILPTLYDEDLKIIKTEVGDLVTVLRTEDFTPGIGYYAERWGKKIKPLKKEHL